MNMFQSIYKVFWTDILCPMKSFLGWKRISKDVRGCYFQAARLVRYIHNVLSTYLLRCFVSSTYDEITECMIDNANADVLCNLAMSYPQWLMKSVKSSDQHLLLEFVNAYHYQDSIMIDSGYSLFAPQWKCLANASTWEHITSSWIASSETISIRVSRR